MTNAPCHAQTQRGNLCRTTLLGSLIAATLGCHQTSQQTRLQSENGSSFSSLLRVGSQHPEQAQNSLYQDDDGIHPAASHAEHAGPLGALSYIAFNTKRMSTESGDLVKASLKAVSEFENDLRVSASELVKANNSVHEYPSGVAVVTFEREISGLMVDKAFMQLRWYGKSGAYKLGEIVNQMAGAVESGSAYNVSAPNLQKVVGFEPKILKKSEILFPQKGSGTLRYVRAQRFEITDADGGRHYTVTFGPSGDLVEAVDHNRSARHTLKARVYSRSYFYGEPDVELPLIGASVSGSNGNARTDKNGNFDHQGGGVSITLQGPAARIINSGERQTYSFRANPRGDESVVNGNSEQVDIAALNAYVQIHRAVAYTSKYIDPSRTSFLTTPINVTVNFGGNCNAFYNGSITMYAASRDCGNMSEVNDVLYHEWGHGLDAHTGSRGGITDSAFSEGIGDIVAAYMTKSPNMSPGFFKGRERGIRQMENDSRYPEDRGEVHDEGTIIGGTFWDLRQAMIERYGEQKGADKAADLFFKHILTTDNYTSSYRAVLALNDDDNNPATRSPDHCLINEAFAGHGLATDEDCTDEVANEDTPEEDRELYLMLVEGSRNALTLAVGTEKNQTVFICEGDKDACLNAADGESSDFVSTSLSHTKSGRRIYKADQTISPDADKDLTILTFDGSGDVSGYRQVQLERQ